MSFEVPNGHLSVHRILEDGVLADESLGDEVDVCKEWIRSGDAESGSIDDWEVKDDISGSVGIHDEGPPGSTRSYAISGQNSVNSGPGQDIDVSCLEVGKQYKITALFKIMNDDGTPYFCDKYAEWLDPDFCPLFTVWTMNSNQIARYNIGNDYVTHKEWETGEWNPYHAVFTVDEQMAAAGDAYVYFRGVHAPGVTILFDDVSISEYVGENTRYNFWTTPAIEPRFYNDETSITNITWSFYDTPYISGDDTSCEQMVKNGDAENASNTSSWFSLGAEGGSIFLHSIGPNEETKSFKHVDRPQHNSGPGQINLDTNCFKVGSYYEFRAKIKLLDENGFPYPCDRSKGPNQELSCPIVNIICPFEDGDRVMTLVNDIESPWIMDAFNEFHAIFPASERFVEAHGTSWLFNGPRAGVSVVFDDVSLTEATNYTPPAGDLEEGSGGGRCYELVTSGNADTGNITDWEVKEVPTGMIVLDPSGPPGSTKSYKHVDREHISSGPGQNIDVSCLVEGKQYILTAMIKIIDQGSGEYACDKYAEWRDPDFCPLFAIWTNRTAGIAKWNIGNDYPQHYTWQEGEWNPYSAVFTVDERLATAETAYLYARGSRVNVAVSFNKISLREYVGTDTRFNFWTSPPPPLGIDSSPDVTSTDEGDGGDVDEAFFNFTYKHYTETYDYSTGPCTQLVMNGDAEHGDSTGWEAKPSGGGSIMIHNAGPFNETLSFKIVDRNSFNTGMGQDLDIKCLEVGMIYEVKAKIKLLDENGFPFACTGGTINEPGSCPLFSIVAVLATGEHRYITKWNDLRQPWYRDYYNEFHAIFVADEVLVHAVKTYWFFRGPRHGVTMLYDDISIMLYEHQANTGNGAVQKPADCSKLVVNGDAESGTTMRWEGIDGNGFMSIADFGPGNQTHSFQFFARTHQSNGPGQEVYIGCLEHGSVYAVTAKIYLENGKGEAYACDPKAQWGTRFFCTWATVQVRQPWGIVKYNFVNDVKETMVAGWNDFRALFTVTGGHNYPTQAYIFFRGPPVDTVIYIDDIEVIKISNAPDIVPLVVPQPDPAFVCEGFCCEMVKNGGADGDIMEWFALGDEGGSVMKYDKGADGSSSSVTHKDRSSINSGPGQYIDPGCFVEGAIYELKAKILLMDDYGNFTTCAAGADWNDDTFCPLFSFAYRNKDEYTHWFDVPNDLLFGNSSMTWVAGEFNEYHSFFQVDAKIASAVEMYFLFRGPPGGIQIIVDSVSLSPYQHIPNYDGTGDPGFPEVYYDVSKNKTAIAGYNETVCDVLVVNGDLETGDTTGWLVNNGGVLDVRACDEDGGRFCLQVSQRLSRCMGPMQPLPPDCIKEGRHFEFYAKIKMLDEAWQPYTCDKLAGRFSNCPLVSIKYELPSGEWKWEYVGNTNFNPWIADEYNEFYGTFVVSAGLASAKSAFWYFERPPGGITILIDGVRIEQFIDDPDPVYKAKSESCEEFIYNGDAESGDTRGWTARFGGDITLLDEGADLTQHSILSSGRRSFVMGPKHDLVPKCFVPGMLYKFEARMKLVDEETGLPFECDRTHLWVDELTCPLLTFQMNFADGSKEWMYYNDETKGKWQASTWNYFHTSFQVTQKITEADDGYFYFERVRAGINIIFDEVKIYRDCTVLIPNWNADVDEVMPWAQYGGPEQKEVKIVQGGHNGSPRAFASVDRTRYQEGPGHVLDIGCMMARVKYQFSAYFKLLDSNQNGAPMVCDKLAPWADPKSCPLFSLVMNLPSGKKVLNMANANPDSWVANKFNRYEATFEVTDEMMNATSAYMMIKGPRPGVDIIFDQVEISIYDNETLNCDRLIENGQFETSNMETWDVHDHGTLKPYREGANGSMNSLLCTDRLATSDGPVTIVNNMCMVEGRQYELTAYIKLLDEDMKPYKCDKSVPYGDPQSCPLLEIEMVYPTGYYQTHPENTVTDEWIADKWNVYTTIFTVSKELANAEKAYFKFKGPFPGISIVLDDMQASIYSAPEINCNQLIKQTNAENGLTTGWDVNAGGYIEVVADGDGDSEFSFGHYKRNFFYSGPKQVLEKECLVEGKEFEVNARFKLLNLLGDPIACDKNAPWRDDDYCVLMTFEMALSNGVKRVHVGNNYGAPWVAEEFNSFRARITITKNMVDSKSIFLYFQGPRAGVTILFDNISMKAVETTA